MCDAPPLRTVINKLISDISAAADTTCCLVEVSPLASGYLQRILLPLERHGARVLLAACPTSHMSPPSGGV